MSRFGFGASLKPQTEAGRWELADRLARGQADDIGAQIYRQRLVPARVLGLVAGVVVAAAIGFGAAHGHHSHSTHHHSSTPVWRLVLGGVLLIGGLAFEIWALWRLRQDRFWASNRTSPLLALNRRERRQVTRQVLGRTAAEPDRLAVTRSVAQRVARLGRMGPLYLGLIAIFAGNAVASPSVHRLILAIAYVVVYSGLILYLRNYASRAKVFLDQHPLPVG